LQVATIGPKNTIAFAIGVNFVFFVIYALDLVTTMERVYAMVAFGTLGYVAYPTITSAQQRRPPPCPSGHRAFFFGRRGRICQPSPDVCGLPRSTDERFCQLSGGVFVS
jgi:hypothetical protein